MEYSGTAGCQSRLLLQPHWAGGEHRQSSRAHRQNAESGAITHQPFSEDGKSACALDAKFVPVSGWWPDKGDVMDWYERGRVYRAIKELKREGEDLKLEKAIEPIREVYSRLNPSRRSMFIAQVVYLLTK